VFEREIEALESKNLLRTVLSRHSFQGPEIILDRKKIINFSSNDYLGLANHHEVIRSVENSLRKYGFGSGASRLLAGGSDLHRNLEKEIAKFKETQAAVVFNSGYAANTGIIPAITSENDVIFSDELNHASIIDGCRLSRAETVVYRHSDPADLKRLLRKSGSRRKIVITDTVFSMDGDLAPLPDIHAVCLQYGAVLYLDDAHGTGVLGRGKGALAHYNLKADPWILQIGTFSKALGAFGAFAAAGEDLIRWISNTARSFLFSTALPSCVIAGADAGLRLVRRNPLLMDKLWANRERLSEGLRNIGMSDKISATPILTLRTGSIEEALRISEYLYKRGIYVPAIRPPSVTEPRLRVTVTAAHKKEHIARLLDLLKKAVRRS
jgi:8-amino-7-oxononanoate synthase